MTRTKSYEWLAWNGIWIIGLLLLTSTAGLVTFGLATLIVLAFWSSVRYSIELVAALFNRTPKLSVLRKLTLASLSIMLGLVVFEGFLAVMARVQPPPEAAGGAGSQALAMPEEWKMRDTKIEGASRAYYWQNVLHVFNNDNMRVVGEFRPKRPDTFRVMVVGDSMTYGQGIGADVTYSALLERDLGNTYRIEVLNLGRMGDQSEDALQVVRKFLPRLKPDMVVYGVCLNDFLPSQMGQYENNQAWSISFPLQDHFTKKTRVGGFLAKKYDDLLIALGVRADFWTDILRDFDGYQQRFGRDVKELNDLVVGAGLPPVTTLVLNQFPGDEKGLRIAAIAEKYLAEAGMQLVPSKGYAQKHRSEQLMVSPWDGHPNAKCHAIFAGELQPYIERAPGLEKFRGAAELPNF